MKFVIVESPYAGNIEENIEYARQCIRDCLVRGEAPFASHLLYTQPNVFRDEVPQERSLGIKAGHEIMKRADLVVVYEDRGISHGMVQGIESAKSFRIPIEYRSIKNKDASQS